MSTLSIRKKSLKTWLHTDSILGSFIISKFYFNADGLNFQIVEQGQSRRVIYNITDITLYDDTDGGSAETFANITDLSLRLEDLNYPAFFSDGQTPIPSLNDLTNVNITSVADNQILVYDLASNKWVNENAGAVSGVALVDLTDVDISTPLNGQVLTYNSVSGKWENETPSGGGAVSSVNGQTGVVALGLTEILTESGTASDLVMTLDDSFTNSLSVYPQGIDIYGTSGKSTIITEASIALGDTVSGDESNLANQSLLISNATENQSVEINKNKIRRSKSGFNSDLIFTDPTANRSITFKDESGTVAYLTDVAGVSDGDKGDIIVSAGGTVWTIENGVVNNAKVASGIDAVKLADGSVTNTELQYINSLSSNAQTQLDGKQVKMIKQGYTQLTGLTGTQVLASLEIPANWLASGDGIEIGITPNKSITAAGIQFSIYQDTTLNGTANAIATATNLSTSTRSGYIQRILYIDGTTLRPSSAQSSTSNVPISTSNPSTSTFDPTVANYITITVNPTVISEVTGFNQFYIRKL